MAGYMPRPPRQLLAGAFYHVTIRGNDRQRIFRDSADYRRYLAELKTCCRAHHCLLIAYALMPNHVHVVIQDQTTQLSKCMHALHLGYTRYFNSRHQRIGQLYQGRFHSRYIDRDAYLLEVTRYVHLNPLRAGLSDRPIDYAWSSYLAYLDPEIAMREEVYPQLIWDLMDPRRKQSCVKYQAFVETLMKEQLSNWESRLRDLKLIGSTRFASEMAIGAS